MSSPPGIIPLRPALRVLAACLLPVSAAVADPSGPGWGVTRFAGGGDLSYVTSLAFDADGVLFAGEANLITGAGRVVRLPDADGDGIADRVEVVATGLGAVTGIAFLPSGGERRGDSVPPRTVLERIRRGEMRGRRMGLVVSHFESSVGGTISILEDRNRDGVAESRRDVVTDLPSDGLNANQQPAIGPDGLVYFGQGARTNAGVPGPGAPADAPENGTILRVRPDGTGLEIVARGLRNAFDLAFMPDGELFATDNGPDPGGPGPVAGAPDELNSIVSGAHYGWPSVPGFPPEGSGIVGPVATFGASTSTDGLALVTEGTLCGHEGDLVAAQFGSFTNPSIGRRLVLIDFLAPHAVVVEPIATGFGRPLDVVLGPDGGLWVADFSNAFFAPGSAAVWHLVPDAPCD